MSTFSSSSSNDRERLIIRPVTPQQFISLYSRYSLYRWFLLSRPATETSEIALRRIYPRANEPWSTQEKHVVIERIRNGNSCELLADDLRRQQEEICVVVWNYSAVLAETFNLPKPNHLPPTSFDTGLADPKEAQPAAPTLEHNLSATSSDQKVWPLSDSGPRSSKIALEDQNTGKHPADLPPLLSELTAKSVRFQGDETVQDCAKQSGIAQEKTEAKAAVPETKNPETTAPKNTAGTTVVAPAAPATKPETPAVAPDPSAVAAKAPTVESALPEITAKTPVIAGEISSGTPEIPAVEPIVPALTTEISVNALAAPTVESEIPTGESVAFGTLTSDPAGLEKASPKTSQPIMQVAETTSSAKHVNAMFLGIFFRSLRQSPASLLVPADFVPLPNANYLPYVQSLLEYSATPEYDAEDSVSPLRAGIDPTQSKLTYVDCFNKKAHALAEEIRQAKRQGKSTPWSKNTFVVTPKGLAQREVPPFLQLGTAEQVPFTNLLLRDQFTLQHAFVEFPSFLKDPEDRQIFIDIFCAALGIDRDKAFVAIHEPNAEHYNGKTGKPHAAHAHIAFTSTYAGAFRRLNPFRHVGARLSLAALDVLCGNNFLVPCYRRSYFDSIVKNTHELKYRFLRGSANHRYSFPELLDSGFHLNDLDDSGLPNPHDLFDKTWLIRVLPPDKFICDYSAKDGPKSFSQAIHRTFRLGNKTQKKKIEADLKAADRFQAASENITNRPGEMPNLPQHLLRRATELMSLEIPNNDDCRRFMELCLGVHADPEIKAATLLHLAGGLRQGKAESLRCVRYWTGQ